MMKYHYLMDCRLHILFPECVNQMLEACGEKCRRISQEPGICNVAAVATISYTAPPRCLPRLSSQRTPAHLPAAQRERHSALHSLTQSIETQSIETKSIETQSIETKSIETQSIETQSIETQSIETQSIASLPGRGVCGFVSPFGRGFAVCLFEEDA